MSRWIDSNLADRLYMVNHVSDSKDIAPESIEKDWWVTTEAVGPTAVATSPWGCLSKGLSLTMQSNVQDLGANNKKAQ